MRKKKATQELSKIGKVIYSLLIAGVAFSFCLILAINVFLEYCNTTTTSLAEKNNPLLHPILSRTSGCQQDNQKFSIKLGVGF